MRPSDLWGRPSLSASHQPIDVDSSNFGGGEEFDARYGGTFQSHLDALANAEARRARKRFLRRRKQSIKREQMYEGLDYDVIDNEIFHDQKERLLKSGRTGRFCHHFLEIAISIFIGVIVGFVAWIIHYTVREALVYKMKWIHHLHATTETIFAPLFAYLMMSFIPVALSAALVAFVARDASSSGVAEVKCYLNGIHIPRLFHFKTLVVKIVGLLLAMAGGVAGGKEGPMVHIGAGIAASLSQGKSTTVANRLRVPLYEKFGNVFLRQFRNDHEKRGFVSSGASVGMSAAFGAPIGGVLYSIEEGSSFWSGPLTARTFLACIMAILVVTFFHEGAVDGDWGQIGAAGLIDFGHDRELQVPYSIAHFPFFIVIAVVGGLLGALFNTINAKLHRFRLKNFSNAWGLMTEGCLIGLVTSLVYFLLPYFWNSCSLIPLPPSDHALEGHSCSSIETFPFHTPKELPRHLGYSGLYCNSSSFNQIGSIFFQDQESAIRTLNSLYLPWQFGPLVVGPLIVFFLSAWTFGSILPNGVLAPAILVGSAVGRVIGMLVHLTWPHLCVDLATFSLIGAASLLGGITRLAISITVLLAEATDNASNVLPMIIVVLISHWVGGLFNNGIYVQSIDNRKIPMLDWDLPTQLKKFQAGHVCNRPAICFRKFSRVSQVIEVLRNTSHNGFPVVDEEGSLLGLVMRFQLVILLKHKAFAKPAEVSNGTVRELPVECFTQPYPRYPTIAEVEVTEREMNRYFDLSPYISNPLTVQTTTPLTRVFHLFRTMGLRHVIVVDRCNIVVGMITRKDLSKRSTIAAVKAAAKGKETNALFLGKRAPPPSSSDDDFDRMIQSDDDEDGGDDDGSEGYSSDGSYEFMEDAPSRSRSGTLVRPWLTRSADKISVGGDSVSGISTPASSLAEDQRYRRDAASTVSSNGPKSSLGGERSSDRASRTLRHGPRTRLGGPIALGRARFHTLTGPDRPMLLREQRNDASSLAMPSTNPSQVLSEDGDH